LIFSNGISKEFLASGHQSGKNFTSFGIPDFSVIKKIKGTILGTSHWFYKLCFSAKDGTEIAKVECSTSYPYGPE
jgi:hypothetical protein